MFITSRSIREAIFLLRQFIEKFREKKKIFFFFNYLKSYVIRPWFKRIVVS